MNKPSSTTDLSVIQKTYDLVKWWVPLLNRLPKDHKFTLSERIINGLYDLLENLVRARYMRRSADKLQLLEAINIRLEILRQQNRLLYDFALINTDRHEIIARGLNVIGMELGGWIKRERNTHDERLR
ncbi:MAG: diversity-generating retroelement protein Avd [Methylococcales bacterium]